MAKKLRRTAVILLLAGGASASILSWTHAQQIPDLDAYASRIIAQCAGADSHPGCYDQNIPPLLQVLTMRQAFDVIARIQQQDPSYWFCHAVAHKLSDIEYQKDPSNWIGITDECPVGMCSNGCIHGAIEDHFASSTVSLSQLSATLPAISSLCEDRPDWHPTPEEQSSCYHEIGHFSLLLADSNPEAAATEICDNVSVKPDGRNFLQTCHEGIFMEVFEPREPDDFAAVYPLVPDKKAIASCEKYTLGFQKGACWENGWKGHVASFCDEFQGDIRNACYREAWVVDSNEIRTPQGIVAYCSYSSDPIEKTKCYNKLFYSLMSMTNFDYKYVEGICLGFNDKALEGQCFANTSSRLIETDTSLSEQSAEVCRAADAHGVGDACWKELHYYAAFSFVPNSPAQQKLCSLFPPAFAHNCGSMP